MTTYIRLSERIERIARIAMRKPDVLTMWEANFLRGLHGKTWGSWKQIELLERIEAKVLPHEEESDKVTSAIG